MPKKAAAMNGAVRTPAQAGTPSAAAGTAHPAGWTVHPGNGRVIPGTGRSIPWSGRPIPGLRQAVGNNHALFSHAVRHATLECRTRGCWKRRWLDNEVSDMRSTATWQSLLRTTARGIGGVAIANLRSPLTCDGDSLHWERRWGIPVHVQSCDDRLERWFIRGFRDDDASKAH